MAISLKSPFKDVRSKIKKKKNVRHERETGRGKDGNKTTVKC